ncbi:MAG: hypothetical protein ABIR73_00255 [Usitatibacter sp.]
MVTLTQLWMPILLAAVLVFVASSLIHMVFKWHNPDYRKLGNEEEVRAALRATGAAPGQYMIPYCIGAEGAKDPVIQKKWQEGPIGFLMMRPAGMPSMGGTMAMWFAVTLLVALAAGYLASRTVPVGASFLAVCRVVGGATFLAYAFGGPINAIWGGKPWVSAAKEVLDAAIYATVSACAFAWLWPR